MATNFTSVPRTRTDLDIQCRAEKRPRAQASRRPLSIPLCSCPRRHVSL
jgi:hypothetical protein